METFTVGQELKVWSEKVMGVAVHFTVEKVGTKYLHGTFRYGLAEWKDKIVPGRIVGS